MAQHDLAYDLSALNWRAVTGTDNDYRLVKNGNTLSWKRKDALVNGDVVVDSYDTDTSALFHRVISTGGVSYESIATWNGASYPGGSTTTVFAYANATLGLHYSCQVATTGTAPMTQPAAGTYRIRVTGGGTSAAQTGLIGTISNFTAQDGATNQCTIRIGTSSQWQAAFGTVPATGVVWHFERQTAPPPPPLTPMRATWDAGSGAATMTAIYQSNGVLAVNDNELTGTFPTDTSGMWRIRRADNTAIAPLGALTVTQGAGFKTIYVGALSDMVTAFGSSQITSGPDWVLENSFYPTPTLVVPAYHEVARWYGGITHPSQGSVVDIGEAQYFGSTHSVSGLRNSILVNLTPADPDGSLPSDAKHYPLVFSGTGQYRLTRTQPGVATSSVTGVLNVNSVGVSNTYQRKIRVQSFNGMGAAFGTATQTPALGDGVVWTLEEFRTTPLTPEYRTVCIWSTAAASARYFGNSGLNTGTILATSQPDRGPTLTQALTSGVSNWRVKFNGWGNTGDVNPGTGESVGDLTTTIATGAIEAELLRAGDMTAMTTGFGTQNASGTPRRGYALLQKRATSTEVYASFRGGRVSSSNQHTGAAQWNGDGQQSVLAHRALAVTRTLTSGQTLTLDSTTNPTGSLWRVRYVNGMCTPWAPLVIRAFGSNFYYLVIGNQTNMNRTFGSTEISSNLTTDDRWFLERLTL